MKHTVSQNNNNGPAFARKPSGQSFSCLYDYQEDTDNFFCAIMKRGKK